MILYLDTSAIVKIYVRERNSSKVQRLVQDARWVSTGRIAYPEARAALARRNREGKLSAAGLRRAASALERDLGRFAVVEMSPEVSRMAGNLAERHALRAYDAVHLASAVSLARWVQATILFSSFDDRLNAAAVAAGLTIR